MQLISLVQSRSNPLPHVVRVVAVPHVDEDLEHGDGAPEQHGTVGVLLCLVDVLVRNGAFAGPVHHGRHAGSVGVDRGIEADEHSSIKPRAKKTKPLVWIVTIQRHAYLRASLSTKI